jgi:hypothetical protein
MAFRLVGDGVPPDPGVIGETSCNTTSSELRACAGYAGGVRCVAITVLATLGALAGGCRLSQQCLSRPQVDTVQEELRSRNRARAEPAVRAAVKDRAAELLPVEANAVRLPPPCALLGAGEEPDSMYAGHDPAWTCQVEPLSWALDAPDGDLFHLKDGQGKLWLALTVSRSDLPYARLARRGSTVFFLRPRMSRRKVGDRTECECDGMPRPVQPEIGVFVIEDVPSVKIEMVDVPMTEDIVDWGCKNYAL